VRPLLWLRAEAHGKLGKADGGAKQGALALRDYARLSRLVTGPPPPPPPPPLPAPKFSCTPLFGAMCRRLRTALGPHGPQVQGP
jgi:hypothetical protein